MNTTVNVAMLLHQYAARVKDTTMLRHDQNSARKKAALGQKSNTIMMSTTRTKESFKNYQTFLFFCLFSD
jgi:hypothetical protein